MCTIDEDAVITFRPADDDKIRRYCSSEGGRMIYNDARKFVVELTKHLNTLCFITKYISSELTFVNFKEHGVKCPEDQKNQTIIKFIKKSVSKDQSYFKYDLYWLTSIFNNDAFFSYLTKNEPVKLSIYDLLVFTNITKDLQNIILYIFHISKVKFVPFEVWNACIQVNHFITSLIDLYSLLQFMSKYTGKTKEYTILLHKNDHKDLCNALVFYRDAFLHLMKYNGGVINELAVLASNDSSTDEEFFKCIGYGFDDETEEASYTSFSKYLIIGTVVVVLIMVIVLIIRKKRT